MTQNGQNQKSQVTVSEQYATLAVALSGAQGANGTILSLQTVIVFMVWSLVKSLTGDKISGTPTGNAFLTDGSFSLLKLLNAVRQTYRATHGYSTMLGQKSRATQYFNLAQCAWVNHADGNAVTDKDLAMRAAMRYLQDIMRYTGGDYKILASLFDKSPLSDEMKGILAKVQANGLGSLTDTEKELLAQLALIPMLKKHGIANGVQPKKKESKEMPKDAVAQFTEWIGTLPESMRDTLFDVVARSKRLTEFPGYAEIVATIKPIKEMANN